jgi:heme exporter protein D
MAFLRGYAALLSYKYWLNLHPVPFGPTLVNGVLAFFVWFLVAAIVLFFVARSVRKQRQHLADVLRRLARPLTNAGLLGLLFLFFTYEQVPVLGMRLWFLVTFVIFFVQIGRAVSFIVIDYPRLQRADAEKARIEKYLPKKK